MPAPSPTCDGYDPTGNSWRGAEQALASALSTAVDAEGNRIQVMPTGVADRMPCFHGSADGNWTYFTIFATPTLALTEDVNLPLLGSDSCECTMHSFVKGTPVSAVVAALAGPPYRFIGGSRGPLACTPPPGTLAYNGDPSSGCSSCAF
jgi:hypothetical protein